MSTPLHLQQAPWFISGWLLLRPRPAIPLHLLLLSPSREGPWSSCPPSSRGPSGAQPSPSTSLKGPGHPLNKPLSGIALHPPTPTTLPPLPQPVALLSPTPLKASRRQHFPPQLPGSLVVPSVCGPCQLPLPLPEPVIPFPLGDSAVSRPLGLSDNYLLLSKEPEEST